MRLHLATLAVVAAAAISSSALMTADLDKSF
jgi:hypothetical protein